MKKRTALAALAAALLATTAASTGADAAGFRLPEGGAKAMGMGFAFTAQADDPSAIYFNPAGLTQLSGTHFMGGATYVREKGQSFTGSTALDNTVSENQNDLNFYIPNMYLARRSSTTGWAYGIGVFTPFGLGQEYESKPTSAFRYLTTKIDLMTLCVNPTIAYQVNDALSVGFGIDYLYGKARLSRWAVDPITPTPLPSGTNLYDFGLKGDGDAWGYNAGIQLKLTPSTKVGASYRSRFDLDLEGDVDITNIHPALRPGFDNAATFRTTGSTTLHLPATFAAGFSYNDGPVTFNLDGDWTMWSSYQDLSIRVNGPGAGSTSVSPKRWKNVMAFRMGGEYRVIPALALRAGYAFDPTPVPQDTLSAELPDADRNCYTAGLGYKVGPVTLDASYFYLQKKDRTVRQTAPGTPGINGKWEGEAHLVALDLGYRF